MGKTWVIVVGPGHVDAAVAARAAMFGVPVERAESFRIVHLSGDVEAEQIRLVAERLLVDPVGQWWKFGDDHHPEGVVVETGLRPGVTDREGAELVRAATSLGVPLDAATVGRRFVIDGVLDAGQLEQLADRVLHNDVIERWAVGSLPAAFLDQQAKAPATTTIDLDGFDEAGLAAVNAGRRLGLDPEEMVVIQAHFAERGRPPTDAELETLAQTWSEHCAHKTFRAEITIEGGDEPEVINSLMKTYLRAATDTIDAPWVRSAFVDNAGILDFEDGWEVAIKAETHNHPSALEPFGGSNTGVGGVVRDILGVSAKPVAVTDILCFGPEDTDPADVPDGVLHPQRIREGVIAGVGDYGNKIGVPNIAGAVVHDPSYTTTPLVFAGCLGLLPAGSNPTAAQAGDSIVVFGGAVGRDGVGGATFSSQTMGVETADVAGSSVQIGDPIVEKGLIDVIEAARDAQLYSAITDCGAGGLSSAVGEMAEVLGADVDLALVPRKYPGLAPWEVWLSEAQERMVVAAPDPAPLLALAERWSVGAAVIGTFTGEGRLVVRDGSDTVIDIDCEFLHDGRPQRKMVAAAVDTDRPERQPLAAELDASSTLLSLLAHPSIRSNESIVRTFDHEVLGGTLVRPYGGPEGDGPADGTVLIPPGTSGERGIALGIGVNALYGRIDPEAMAWHVIDEAVRNVVIAGADPNELSLLDNFAWGNPTDPATLGGLVAACRGCHDAAVAFNAPFVSGKDSLYNVFVRPDGTPTPSRQRWSSPRWASCEISTWCRSPVWSPQPTMCGWSGQRPGARWLAPRRPPRRGSRRLTTCHRSIGDRSPSGDGRPRSPEASWRAPTTSARADWLLLPPSGAFAGRRGLALDVDDTPETLFGEGPGRYLVEVDPENEVAFAAAVPGAQKIGVVLDDPVVVLGDIEVSLDDIGKAWRATSSELEEVAS